MSIQDWADRARQEIADRKKNPRKREPEVVEPAIDRDDEGEQESPEDHARRRREAMDESLRGAGYSRSFRVGPGR